MRAIGSRTAYIVSASRQRLRAIEFEGRTALLCLPGLVLILGFGVLVPAALTACIVAAGGALSVGFGSVHAFTRRRWAAMALAAIGMSLSAFAGSLAGNDEIALLAACAVWAAACAMFASIEFGAWWILLQWAIALFVAGYYPADLTGATERAALVLAGGVVQIVCILIGWYFRGGPPQQVAHHSISRMRKSFRLARKGKLPTARHAVRAAVSVVLAFGIVHWLALPNGYWAPMTALLVLKPQLRATRTRGVERLVGTLIGSALAGLVSLAAPAPPALLALALGAMWLSYGLQKSDYVVFTAAITAAIVFMLGLAHEPEILAAGYRLAATALGGGLALAIAFLTGSGTFKRLAGVALAGDKPQARETLNKEL